MKINLLNILFLIALSACNQSSFAQRVENPEFEKKIESLIGYQVPVITVSQLQKDTVSSFVFLDARESEEYNISHIPNAKYIGYDNFNIASVADLSRDSTVVVYCSIGFRSDKIGGELKKAGFSRVYNLYGSIFEWANQGHKMVDNNNQSTLKLHTYNKNWSKWVTNPEIIKVW